MGREKDMVKNIQDLLQKMENTEKRRLKAGRDHNGCYAVFENYLRDIENAESFSFDNTVERNYQFLYGFLYGLCAAHFITDKELKDLSSELSVVCHSYHDRCIASIAAHNENSEAEKKKWEEQFHETGCSK